MKPLHLAAALIPLACIAFWVLLGKTNQNHQITQPNQMKQVKAGMTTSSSPNQTNSAQKISSVARDLEQEGREIDARRAKNFENMSKIVANHDPQMTIITVDKMMRSREPRYRELFNQWKLDEEKISQVLGILRQKRIDKSNERIRQAREKTHEVGDMSDPARVDASRNKGASKEQAIELVAETQLLPILGTERYLQLMALDKQLLREVANRAEAAKE